MDIIITRPGSLRDSDYSSPAYVYIEATVLGGSKTISPEQYQHPISRLKYMMRSALLLLFYSCDDEESINNLIPFAALNTNEPQVISKATVISRY